MRPWLGLSGLSRAFFLSLLLCASAPGQDSTHTVTEATSPTLSFAGSLAQLASAGGWDTSLTLVNLGTTAGEARSTFTPTMGADCGCRSPWRAAVGVRHDRLGLRPDTRRQCHAGTRYNRPG